MMKRGALLVALFLPLMPLAVSAELVNLDDFIAGADKGDDGCSPNGLLSDFLTQVAKRYVWPGMPELKLKVKITEQFAAAIGKARVEKHESHTTIRVPLVGTYRGLPTRELAFDFGHDEHVDETRTRILFDVSTREVEKVFGADIARATKGLGELTAVSRDQGAELVCRIALM